MKKVEASEFNTRCAQLTDEVVVDCEPVTITENGRPIAELCSIKNQPTTLFGAHAGQVEGLDDIIAPIDEPWEGGDHR